MDITLTHNQKQLKINFVKEGLKSVNNTRDIFELLLVLPNDMLKEIHTPNILTMLFMKRYRQIITEKQTKDLEDKIVLNINEYEVLTDVVSSFNIVKRKYKGLTKDLKQEIVNGNIVIERHKLEAKDKSINRRLNRIKK